MRLTVTDNIDEMRESVEPWAIEQTLQEGVCVLCKDRLDSGNTTVLALKVSYVRCPVCTPLKYAGFINKPKPSGTV